MLPQFLGPALKSFLFLELNHHDERGQCHLKGPSEIFLAGAQPVTATHRVEGVHPQRMPPGLNHSALALRSRSRELP